MQTVTFKSDTHAHTHICKLYRTYTMHLQSLISTNLFKISSFNVHIYVMCRGDIGGTGPWLFNHQRFFLKYAFNEFSDIFMDSIIDSNETITFIIHAMYIVLIHSQSKLSVMYILAAL